VLVQRLYRRGEGGVELRPVTGVIALVELAAVLAAACRITGMLEMLGRRVQASSSPAAGLFCLAFLLNIRTPSPRLGRPCGGTEDNVMGGGTS
jgi:hypothetical protein